jgi:hypothetical protein
MRIDNRIFFLKAGLPDEVTADVTPFTDAEKRRNQLLNLMYLLWAFGFPLYSTFQFEAKTNLETGFLSLFLHACLVYFSFWLVDLILIDGIILCWSTPSWVVVPGTEGFPGYKDFGRHVHGHLGKGLLFVGAAGLIAASFVRVL